MEKISNIEKLNYYISKYNIDNIFSIDMKPYMELFCFNKNEYICKADEEIQYLFFFISGKAKVYTLLSNGKALLLCFYKPFMVLGDVEFIHSETASTYVQTIEETYCIGISLENIRKLVLNDCKFLKFMCHCLGEKLIRLGKYSSINLLYPLENRLSSYILAVTSSNIHGNTSHIIFEGNLAEVSELLGASYRHLLRTINVLCNEGAIKKNGRYYEIVNPEMLKNLAGDLYE